LVTDLGMTGEIDTLKGMLSTLNDSLNSRRTTRGEALIGADVIEAAAKHLWEEVTVRAETFYFELQRWSSAGAEKEKQPGPNYLSSASLKDVYLKEYGILTAADVSALTADEGKIIDQIAGFLLFRQRNLIKRRGVINAFLPNPLEPRPPTFVTPPPV